MGKFSFPGRKKQPPQVTVTGPVMSKAQKILGSTALNIDDEFSASKVSLAATERSVAASYASSIRSYSRAQREWGDESDIVPRHLRNNALPTDEDEDTYDYGDVTSDMTSVLRKRQSTSTLSSWYDKSKQPLSISQQTSNSAMAKGLPTKAQKMLDMDHSQASKSRKKPAKLDLSQIMSRRGKKNERQPWEGPILGTDQVVKSPSLLSPLTSPSFRGRLQRRPTKESLRSMHSEHAKPSTPDNSRQAQNHLEGLPNLYEHYEQMSFRQVMEEDTHSPDESEEKQKQKQKQRQRQKQKQQEPPPTKVYNLPASRSAQHISLLPTHHEEHVVSQYAKRTLPQTPQASLISKAEASSPTDCAASVSSRHTRTSKASKRTDRSFQESDLQEKSVLSLSSDSEEDDVYLDNSFRGPSSVPDYPASDSGSIFDHRPVTSRTTQSADNKRFSKASKRASPASSNNFLAIPNGHHIKPSAVSARSSSLSGSSANTIQEGTVPRSPSQLSCLSNSSVNTTMTWQSKSGLGLHQARAITMQTAQGPADLDVDSDLELDQRLENDEGREMEFEADDKLERLPSKAFVRESTMNTGDQPTPPLSPSSVDFYIRSAHSSIDGFSSHNRFMAVTRQEEMLLAALRHKRQLMRETILSEIEDNVRTEQRMSVIPKGHHSKPSEATITESNFDLDFPAPPMCKDKTTVTADGTTIIDLRLGSSQGHMPATGVTNDLPPAGPALPSSKKAVLKAQKEFRNDQHERILLYLDHPLHDENGSIDEAEPSPDLSDFMEFEAEEPQTSDDIVSEVILYPSQTRRSASKRRPDPVKLQQVPSRSPERIDELDVPRPDSPISPDPMVTMPRRGTVNKKTARLSAVGPARWGYEG